MECHNQTKEYLSYNCYNKLKHYFDNAILTPTGKDILNETIKELEVNWPTIKMNHIMFKDFARFLTKHHNFFEYGHPVSCKYINFWLNDQVKNIYSSEFESKFNVFVDFEKKIVTEGIKYNYPKNLCKSYIKELDGDEYRKKEILYKLYYYYTEHKKPTNYQNPEPLCYLINLIIEVSRGAKKYIDDDKDFAKLLRELKVLIQNEKHHKEKCHYSMLKNMLPEEDSKPKVEEVPVVPVDKSPLQDALPKPPNEDLERRVSENIRNVEIGLPHNEGLGQQSKLQEVEPRAEMTVLGNSQELPFTVLQGEDPFQKTMSQEDPYFTTRPQAPRILEQDTESLKTAVHLLDDTHQARSDARGVLGSIQHTLTDVLGSVEPAPILGVSGGMGALFLLFKYTPVGTFFRGRRGRTYGIPIGFNGPFQGGLPVYDDYYGGNVGSDRFHVSYQAE
ncbi:unnamed protein product [Plasmodium vivax]|uniref:(malaria parasite P. vivax) hypothetical protein n=1 Tax=Plasmodium vivax TaxID=5855 RepID=A0A8S4H292_PLAVI|nr:unnamed protein product [Plasmodium vivax]